MPAPASAVPALHFDRVTRTFADGPHTVVAVNDISFSVTTGEIFGVLGESGAGKSTILRLMNGLEQPSSGSVSVSGTDLATLSPRGLNSLRHRVGVVFQSFNLLSNLTVVRNVELPLRLQGIRDPAKVAEIIEFVGLSHRAHHFPAQLSGGEQQRVAIARALVTSPSLLLCDEPTSALDTHTTTEILDLLRATRDEFGTTIILVTHELDAVKAICDRAAVCEQGELRSVLQVVPARVEQRENYVAHVTEVLSA